MHILATLTRLLERALKPFRRRRGIPWTHPALLELHELAERARLLFENPTAYSPGQLAEFVAWSHVMSETNPRGMTDEQKRAFARLVQANSGAPMPEHCFKHDDREPTFVLSQTTLYLCDDCAEEQREAGNIVRPLCGILFGFPVVNADDDGVLDARIIGE